MKEPQETLSRVSSTSDDCFEPLLERTNDEEAQESKLDWTQEYDVDAEYHRVEEEIPRQLLDVCTLLLCIVNGILCLLWWTYVFMAFFYAKIALNPVTVGYLVVGIIILLRFAAGVSARFGVYPALANPTVKFLSLLISILLGLSGFSFVMLSFLEPTHVMRFLSEHVWLSRGVLHLFHHHLRKFSWIPVLAWCSDFLQYKLWQSHLPARRPTSRLEEPLLPIDDFYLLREDWANRSLEDPLWWSRDEEATERSQIPWTNPVAPRTRV